VHKTFNDLQSICGCPVELSAQRTRGVHMKTVHTLDPLLVTLYYAQLNTHLQYSLYCF